MDRTEDSSTNKSPIDKRMPKLSPRLQRLYDLAEGDPVIWDVGTDHGSLPVSLILGGTVGFAVASDINRGPHERARATARQFGVEDRINLRLCDGLDDDIPDDLSTVIIAGLGGETIINICKNAPWIAERSIRLLLQPMSQIGKLRKYIYAGEYNISGEHLVREKGRIYIIMDIVGGGSEESFTFLDTRIGKYTIKDEPYGDYLNREIKRLQRELKGADKDMERLMKTAIENIKELIK